jgi:orotidine-5'-phosphate decarboxylase
VKALVDNERFLAKATVADGVVVSVKEVIELHVACGPPPKVAFLDPGVQVYAFTFGSFRGKVSTEQERRSEQ